MIPIDPADILRYAGRTIPTLRPLLLMRSVSVSPIRLFNAPFPLLSDGVCYLPP